jgi:hypothetical protein
VDLSTSLYVLGKNFLLLLEFGTLYHKKQLCSAHEGKKAEWSRVIPISETKFKVKTNFYAGK